MIGTLTTRPVLSFIRAFTATHGYPPTLREIAADMNLTQPVIYRRLRLAVRDGELETYKPRWPRPWRLTARGEKKAR